MVVILVDAKGLYRLGHLLSTTILLLIIKSF